MPSSTSLVFSASAIVACVALGGCSSSDSGAPTGSSAGGSSSVPTPTTSAPVSSAPVSSASVPAGSPTPPSSPAPATKSPAPTGVKAALTALLLKPGDLPAGWRAGAADSDDDDPALQAELVKCAGGKNTDADEVGRAESQSFASGTNSVSADASRYKTKADIAADIALIKRPLISPCYEALLKRELAADAPAGATIGAVSVQVTPGSNGGPGNVVGMVSARISLTAGGRKTTLYEDVALITGPLTESEVDFTGIGAPFPAALRASLTKLVADRTAKA